MDGSAWRQHTATLLATRASQARMAFWPNRCLGVFASPFPFRGSLDLCRIGHLVVSSSSHFDPAMAYPLGRHLAIDRANTVHWDGAKAGGEPAVLELVGMGGHEYWGR